jgi:hypothetical protein
MEDSTWRPHLGRIFFQPFYRFFLHDCILEFGVTILGDEPEFHDLFVAQGVSVIVLSIFSMKELLDGSDLRQSVANLLIHLTDIAQDPSRDIPLGSDHPTHILEFVYRSLQVKVVILDSFF